GSSCVRTGCQTGSSNPSTTSSTTAATPGTPSSLSRGRSCPSPDATGRPSVTHSEDWYNISFLPLPPRSPELTAKRTYGSSCVRTGCQTGYSNPSTISSI